MPKLGHIPKAWGYTQSVDSLRILGIEWGYTQLVLVAIPNEFGVNCSALGEQAHRP